MKNFLIDNYSKCWKFLIECRWYNVFVTGIFSLLFLIGFTFPVFFRAEIILFIEELIELVDGKGLIETFFFIFFNNLKATFFSIIFGASFGILPFFIAVSNGYLIGFVSREVAMIEGISALWRLFPHGIFELPAVIFSIGIGIKIGVKFIQDLHKKYFKSISFIILLVLSMIILPISLLIILSTFFIFIYWDYILYYLEKKKYFFLIISLLFSPIMFFNLIFNEKLRTSWNENYIEGLRVFLFVVIPLLLLAGIIEAVFIWLST